MKPIIAVGLTTLVLASAAVTPTASAESGCMANGKTQEYCEMQWMASLNSATAVWREPPSTDRGAVVALGYRMIDDLVANPTADQFNKQLNAWLHSFKSTDHCLPGTICTTKPATPEQVAFLLNAAVHWLGPPGLEQTLKQALTVPG
jgi:hypothetical protein